MTRIVGQGTGGGAVESVTGSLPIVVDNTDPANPIVTLPGLLTGSSIARANKDMVASVTVADGNLACATAVATTVATSSAAGGYVGVDVNGVAYSVGDGTKVGVSCYFSADGGTTALAMKAIIAGDLLYWNGTVAGFQLAGTDRVSFFYDVSS